VQRDESSDIERVRWVGFILLPARPSVMRGALGIEQINLMALSKEPLRDCLTIGVSAFDPNTQ